MEIFTLCLFRYSKLHNVVVLLKRGIKENTKALILSNYNIHDILGNTYYITQWVCWLD